MTGISLRQILSRKYEIKEYIQDFVKVQYHYGWIASLRSFNTHLKTRLNQKEGQPNDSGSGRTKLYDPKGRAVFQPPQEVVRRIEKAKKEFVIRKDLFPAPPSIVFISNFLPRYDRTSADYRIHNILNILLANGCSIEYLYCATTPNDNRYSKSLKGKIRFRYLDLDIQTYNSYISKSDARYVCITSLWRRHYSRFMAKLAHVIKQHQNAPKLIVDTMDFHAKEFFRKYQLSRNEDDQAKAKEFLGIEKKLYGAADVVVVVSDSEKKDIQKEISGIKKIDIVPNIQKKINADRGFHKRKNMCYVGHFGNRHNVDAVTNFLENIFHQIREKIPQEEFHVIGAGSEGYRDSFNGSNVKVIGRIKDLQKALTHYKLFVCPMTYGAGMKGKIGIAIEAGLPVVTTSIGAEGFPITDGKECFIADTSDLFAERSIKCMTDPGTWYELSSRSTLMAAENFGPGVVSETLKSLFS